MFRKLFFDPAAPPSRKPWGMHEPEDRMKIQSNTFSFVRRHTKFSLKIFEIDFANEI